MPNPDTIRVYQDYDSGRYIPDGSGESAEIPFDLWMRYAQDGLSNDGGAGTEIKNIFFEIEKRNQEEARQRLWIKLRAMSWEEYAHYLTFQYENHIRLEQLDAIIKADYMPLVQQQLNESNALLDKLSKSKNGQAKLILNMLSEAQRIIEEGGTDV